MSEWKLVQLHDVADVRISNVDKKSLPHEQAVLLCNYMDVYANEYITSDLSFMAATAALNQIDRFRVQLGDVMITKDSETPEDIGIPAVAIDSITDLICGYHLVLLKPDSKKIDGRYLAKQLGTRPTATYFARRAAGSTRYGLSSATIHNTPIRLAPLPQQRRIAEILTTIDEVIEATEKLVAKQQQIKAGLMHDLFTRGLWTRVELDRGDHKGLPCEAIAKEGQLRPTLEEAPGIYRKSPIGLIPKEWRCDQLASLLANTAVPMRSGPFGSSLLKDELVEKGIPLLGIDNVFVERFDSTFKRFVSPGKFAELSRYAVFVGDVVITIMGTVGRCCVIPENIGQALSSKHLWTMTFDQDKIHQELVCWQLNHAAWVKDWFLRHAQGAVMDAIQSTTLRTLRLPVPPLTEQHQILARYRAISDSIDTGHTHLAKLRQLKQGLMHDLLTGRVWVGLSVTK